MHKSYNVAPIVTHNKLLVVIGYFFLQITVTASYQLQFVRSNSYLSLVLSAIHKAR